MSIFGGGCDCSSYLVYSFLYGENFTGWNRKFNKSAAILHQLTSRTWNCITLFSTFLVIGYYLNCIIWSLLACYMILIAIIYWITVSAVGCIYVYIHTDFIPCKDFFFHQLVLTLTVSVWKILEEKYIFYSHINIRYPIRKHERKCGEID